MNVHSNGTATGRQNSIQVSKVPRLDRLFPNCLFGLVELVARAKFGFPDIKKIWFGNAFVYTPPPDDSPSLSSGFELNARISVPADTHERARARLQTYYGISLTVEPIGDVQHLLAIIQSALGQGEPLITSFDLRRLRQGRPSGAFRPHYIAVVGADLSRGRFRIVDSSRGQTEVGLTEFAECIDEYQAQRARFTRVGLTCTSPGVNVAIDSAIMADDVARSLANLSSPEFNCGLNGLRRFCAHLRRAHSELRQPFYVPGLWICSHDRHCQRTVVKYWAQAVPEIRGTCWEWDKLLRRAFDLWFGAHVAVERGLADQNRGFMQDVVGLSERAVEIETAITSLLVRLGDQLQNSTSLDVGQ